MKSYSLKTTPVSSILIDDVKYIAIHSDFILAFSSDNECLFFQSKVLPRNFTLSFVVALLVLRLFINDYYGYHSQLFKTLRCVKQRRGFRFLLYKYSESISCCCHFLFQNYSPRLHGCCFYYGIFLLKMRCFIRSVY